MYFLQEDSRSSGPVVYQLRLLEDTPAWLVIEVENVSPVRSFVLTLFHPGDLQFVTSLKHVLLGCGHCIAYYAPGEARVH